MKLRDHYDWIVLGDHPAALLSAALAAKLGLMTLIIPLQEESTGLPVSPKGLFADTESNFLLGLNPLSCDGSGNGLLGQCLGRLGVLPAEEELFFLSGRAPQILAPEARWSIGPNFDLTLTELKRELGQVGQESLDEYRLEDAWRGASHEYPRFWAQFPERLTLKSLAAPPGKKPLAPPPPLLSLAEFRKKTAHGSGKAKSWFDPKSTLPYFRHLPGGTRSYELLRGAWAALSGGETATPLQSDLLQLLSMAGTAGSFRGGMTAYREFLRRLARRSGATLLEKAVCVRIFSDRGRFIGVQSSQSGQMVGAGAGILGSSLERLPEEIVGAKERVFQKNQGMTHIRGWRFTLAVFADEGALPPGMSYRNVWQEAEGPALEIERADPIDYGYRKPGFCVFFLRTVLPYDESSILAAHLRMTAARMLRKLLEIVPFLEFRIAEIYPDFRSQEWDQEFDQVYPFANLAEIPDHLLVYEGEGLGSSSGMEGLSLASGESYPGMGSMGPTVASMEAVALLAHRSGLPGPLA